MARMKSRNHYPPGGWQFMQPESQWKSPPNASFEQVVQALIQHRRGNNYLVQTHGWSVDLETVRNEVDSYNARICQQMGWTDYIYEGAPDPELPKSTPRPNPSKLASVVAGAEILVEWIKSGAEAVSLELATKRASVCASCPLNGEGDFSRYFTVPVSEAIRREVSRKNEMKLETPYDDQLRVCTACLCPMKLKVWVPLANILPHMDAETKARLHPNCWITKPQ